MAKILIVEDNRELKEFFGLLLEMNGHKIKNAVSLKETTEQIKSFEPHLILMDIMLRGEDGRDICKDIKTFYPNIKVILISASRPMLQDSEYCGADATIEKPFELSKILSKLKNLLPSENTNKKDL